MNLDKARKNVIEQQIRPWGGLNIDANQALSEIPRENFVPIDYQGLVFADIEIPISENCKMFSPKIEGRILDSLNIQKHETVLEIGTGSGYFTAVLAKLAKSVTSIEINKELSDSAQNEINRLDLDNIDLKVGDALKHDFSNQQYDVIIIGCTIPEMSNDFNQLLKPDGRMFAVVGSKNKMKASIINSNNKNKWQSKSLFETHLDYMLGLEPTEKFNF